MVSKYDVVIVGAGPAGISTAITLAQYGLKVALCDKYLEPQQKICGEGIMPPGVSALNLLGISDNIGLAEQHKILGIHYQSGRHSIKARFSEGPGLGLNRLTLLRALRKKAQDLPKLSTYFGYSAKKFCEDRGLEISSNGQRINLKAEIYIGADGIRSKMRDWAQIKYTSSSQKRWAIHSHFALKPWSSFVEIMLLKNIEAYITPVGKKEINVVFLWDVQQVNIPKGPQDAFNYLLEFFPALKKKIGPAEFMHRPRAIGPFYFTPKKIYQHKILLVGDAAGYLDPLTGEGISLALDAGILVGHVIGRRLSGGQKLGRRDLSYITRQYYLRSLGHKLVTKAMLFAIGRPRLMAQALAYLNKNPKLMSSFLSLNMGHLKILKNLPSFKNIGPLAKGLLRQ